MAVDGALRLTEAAGFVFDVDGTLVHRSPDFRSHVVPGALEVLERIRRSGRPLVLFTNGNHVTAEEIARGLSEDGLPVAGGDDAEVVLVTHADEIEIAVLERAAHAVRRGARLMTGSYVPGYAGANGFVLSRGAMITAAIAKVSGARPSAAGCCDRQRCRSHRQPVIRVWSAS